MSQISVNDISSLDGKSGPVISGITTVSSTGYMMIPAGPTEYRGGRGRGIVAGGGPAVNFIEYITISTTGDGKEFGDLTVARRTLGGLASSTRGLFAGGNSNPVIVNTIDYITISATGNAFDFGDLTQVKRLKGSGASNEVRGLWAGGYEAGPNSVRVKEIDFVTIASNGNSSIFGELSTVEIGRGGTSGLASPTRALWGGGLTPAVIDTIDYVTISTLGDSIDFGNLTAVRRDCGSCSNSVRGIWFGGRNDPPTVNIIDYVTIASLGDALDFGDLLEGNFAGAACASPTRGVFAAGNTFPGPATNRIQYVEISTLGNSLDFGDLLNGGREQIGSLSDAHGGLG